VTTRSTQLLGQLGLATGDTSASRTVYAIVVGLVLIGLLLIFLAVWLIRQTRVDLELLAPLERMSESRWRKGDTTTRRTLLDDVRPAGAPTPNWQDPQDSPVALDPPSSNDAVAPTDDPIATEDPPSIDDSASNDDPAPDDGQ
jgi:hypothetical protein